MVSVNYYCDPRTGTTAKGIVEVAIVVMVPVGRDCSPMKQKHSVAASPARETGTQKKIAVPESAQALGPMDRPRRRGGAVGTRPTGGAPAREGAAATSTAPTVPRRRVTRGEGRRLAAEDRSNPRPRWKV